MLVVFRSAGALKSVLAAGRYPAACLQAEVVLLTAFEVGSKDCVLTVLPIVSFMLVQEGKSLKVLLSEFGITVGASITLEIEGV